MTDAVRVVVVDDHAPFRLAMAAMLETIAGFEIAALVESGEESVAIATAVAIDLVMMDVNLPGMSGLEAARAISAHGGRTVVILMSTYGSEGFVPAECGAAAYVDKAELSPERLQEVWASVRLGG